MYQCLKMIDLKLKVKIDTLIQDNIKDYISRFTNDSHKKKELKIRKKTLTNQRKRSQQVPSPTRAVIIGGGIAPSEGNVTSMEKVEISTTGASVDFGTLANGVQAAGYFSNGHGGL